MGGSPPHLRGKLKSSWQKSICLRITPAPAGKTKQWILHRLKHRDHPRTCGENYVYSLSGILKPGSPPHLRGKLGTHAGLYLQGGITPAPAGKTWNSCRFVLAGWDHPRTCGENFPQGRFQVRHLGSPPHLRGKPFKKEIYDAATRITPAPAGKTNNMTHCFYLFEDHPRTCGENKRGDVSQCSFGGSPPHLRGKPV